MKITRSIRSHIEDPLKSFKGLQVIIASICIAIPAIFWGFDRDEFYPAKENFRGLASISGCPSGIKIDTTKIEYHGQVVSEFIVKNSCTKRTIFTYIKIKKNGWGFRYSLSEYAYGSKSYLFGLLYCMAAMLFIYNGFVYQKRRRELRIQKKGHWTNIFTGLCLIGVVFYPESANKTWHYIFSIGFFVGNIIAMLFPKENETNTFKTTRRIMALVIALALIVHLVFNWYSLLWAEWISLAMIASYLIMAAASAEHRNPENNKDRSTHRLHSAFTVAVPIKEGESERLKEVLASLNNNRNSLLNFNYSDTTLFVSGVVIPFDKTPFETFPATFVFATTFCGPLSRHLEELLTTSYKGLCEMFKHCVDFPDDIKPGTLTNYLKLNSHFAAHNSFYNCVTKKDVQREKRLRSEIENYLDRAQKLNAFDTLSALQVKGLIQRHIKTRGRRFEWAHQPDKKMLWEILVIKRLWIGAITILLFLALVIFFLWCSLSIRIFYKIIIVVLILITPVITYLLIALYITRKKHRPAPMLDNEHLRELAASQLHPVLNEMTAAAPLKEGRLRRHFYATALKLINFGNSYLMKVPTVSSLRWFLINNKKRLVFLSNYTNTTDFYVRDFLNSKGTRRGINFMFTNGVGFPDAKLLAWEGIGKDPEGYMNAVHSGQHIADLWYAHHLTLTSDIINKNRKIRNGLFKNMTECDAKKWLKLL